MTPPAPSTNQPTDSFGAAVIASGALFFGIGLLMLGNGLRGSLLGIRASQEHFGSIVIGCVMAAYYGGFFVGSIWVPRALRQAGHIRVFAALAAAASATILIQALFVDPTVWGVMRFATGLCNAGIYVVAESWLNNRASNAVRGQLLAIYMITTNLGLGGGQLLLNVASPTNADLFIVVSVLVSLSVVPLLLSASQGPNTTYSVVMPLRRLVRISPFGTAGVFIAGVINGTVFGMGAVYAHKAGLSVAQVALFMAALVCGGAVLQLPIGRLSDHFDRRLVIIVIAVAGSATALLANVATTWTTPWMVVCVGLFGGLAFTLHSLNLAWTNDCLYPDEMIGASSALVLLLGMGSILGPLVVGGIIGIAGPGGFFWWLAICQFIFAVFGIGCWRYYAKRPDVQRAPYLLVPNQTSVVGSTAAEEAYAEREDRRPN